MGGFSKVSSDTGRRMVVVKGGVIWSKSCKTPTADWRRLSVCALAFEPHQSSE